ncbi:hypothetical protein FRC12_007616, partial [Ceratobasidium sp. 428]
MNMMPELLPEVEQAAIERLWLELDEEKNGCATVSHSVDTITYALDIFEIMWSMQRSGANEPNAAALIASVCLDVDIFDVFGRIILLALRDGTYSPLHSSRIMNLRQDTDHGLEVWRSLQETFPGFFRASAEAAAEFDYPLKASFARWER